MTRRTFLAVIAIMGAGLPQVAAGQAARDAQVRGALFGASGSGAIDPASHRSKETKRQSVQPGSGPEAALLAGAGIISPVPLAQLPVCADGVPRLAIECPSASKRRTSR